LKVGCENIRGFYGKDPDFDLHVIRCALW